MRRVPDVLLRRGEHGDAEVLARLVDGRASDRRLFPDAAPARRYAGLLARRLGVPITDQLAPAAIGDAASRVIVAPDPFDLGFDVEAPGPEHDNPSRHFAGRADALTYAARIAAERGFTVHDRSAEHPSFTLA